MACCALSGGNLVENYIGFELPENSNYIGQNFILSPDGKSLCNIFRKTKIIRTRKELHAPSMRLATAALASGLARADHEFDLSDSGRHRPRVMENTLLPRAGHWPYKL